MNDEMTFEAEQFEANGSSGEFGNQEYEGANAPADRKVPHPQFGMVTPIGQEYGSMETYESGGMYEAGGSAPAKVHHPQFGMVTPISGEYETTEDFEADEAESGGELEFEALNEEIIGGDERFKITRTTTKPWRWVCYLEMRYPTFLATGTGLLISPRHVLTCSHNLYDATNNTPARTVHVSPGTNGASNRPFGRHKAASWKITNEFQSSGSSLFDFALITLKTPIGNARHRKLGGLPLGYFSKPASNTVILLVKQGEPKLRGHRATLSGYPGDKPDGEQWAAKGQVTNSAPAAGRELIYYSSDSCAGHSGSPVWITKGTKAGLIGIHTGPCIIGSDCQDVGPSKCSNTPSRRERTANRAVLITPQLWSRVRAWMR